MSDTITGPSTVAMDQARARQLLLTKPTGALGALEDASIWMAGVQDVCPPRPFTHPRLVIFAGDHGVARTASTSAYPPEVTAQMVANFVQGGAAANVLALQVGVHVRVVDISVDAPAEYLDDLDPSVVSHRIRRSCGSIDREDAMTAAQTAEALAVGAAVADEEIASGADVLIAGDMGIGNTTPAAALIAVLTHTTPDSITGRGTGVDDATLQRKVAAVTAAVGRVASVESGTEALLTAIGSPDIAAMTGYLAQASRRGTPVVLDGVVSCAAALAAEQMQPGSSAWWCAGHLSTEPAARVGLDRLGLRPLVNLNLRLGEGTGALLALPMLQAAAATLADMATFDSAGVTDREH